MILLGSYLGAISGSRPFFTKSMIKLWKHAVFKIHMIASFRVCTLHVMAPLSGSYNTRDSLFQGLALHEGLTLHVIASVRALHYT
jgi:hypothetical protein